MKSSTAYTPGLLRTIFRQSYLVSLLLLIGAVLINYALQPNFFRPGVLNGNLQTFLPLMLLAAGQAVVVIAGGIDLSVGAIISLVNVVIVRLLGTHAGPTEILLAIGAGLLCGVLAGAFNGICVAYLRFQPIVTTFASSFVFSGLALWIMPSPGGSVPSALMDVFQGRLLGIPSALLIIVVILLLWNLLRATRYSRYLYAVGGQAMSAYITGVPVTRIRLSSYMLSGLMAALSALALVLGTGTGDPLVGSPMTLTSIVAVVLGGTRLSGGQGGVAGPMIGAAILSIILNIIAFANVPTWWQTLVNGLIVMIALAGPGLIALVRRQPA
ncbi:ABC transporter permease [Ktedonosporobacter rubrisoli]|uniref:ABC transporter permease n=1 Tax=Ktedonosporobacter rubrisoli TaxID=2509675 RepID=A0A4P6K626_KTERU|nr:ABC transporter permease [Ktedonosporobacter rubrisoli]